jgi:hypothetical protein
MRREEQFTTEQIKSIRTNILWILLYLAALVVLCLDLYVWRAG